MIHFAGIALGILSVAACLRWWRRRGRAGAWLAAMLVLLALTGLVSALPASLPGSREVALSAFMASGYALVELRHTLVPMSRSRRRFFQFLVGVPTFLTLGLVFAGAAGEAARPLASFLLVLVWAACVAEPTVSLWRESRSRPHVQRARMRALALGYAGLALAVVLGVGAALIGHTERAASPMQLPMQILGVLATLPIYAGFAPPGWLRATWRAPEEDAARGLNAALMTSTDEATMAARALDGAIRLLGVEGGALVTPHGAVATSGMTLAEAEAPGDPDHLSLRISLHGGNGEGRLLLRGGPLTPFFGSEEVGRLESYASDIAVALERSRDTERLNTLLRTVGDLGEGLVITEAGRLVYANQAYIDLTGYTKDELMGRQLLDLAPPAAQRELTDRLRSRILGGDVAGHYESQLVRKDGGIVDVETAVQMLSAEGPNRVLALVRDITARKRAETELAAAAMVDALTRIPNRRAWDDELPRALGRARRSATPLCVAMMDVDRFKEYNDDWGHQAGDRLLAEVASSWSATLREVDFLARFGGDEFAVVMPDCAAADATRVLERLEAATPQQRRSSIGLAEWDGEETMEELVGRADAALMEAKRTHRGAIHVARAGVNEHFVGWAATISGLLARQDLRVAYQPICALEDLATVGYEALARSGNDAGESVESLFASAQRLGRKRDLDWLARKVAVQEAGELPAGTLLFLNVSVAFLLDPIHDVDQMLLLLRWADRRPQDIVLEISEREVITDLARLSEVLAAYRAEGFRFALDDVGEGHSTLEVLTAANAEYIKLARSLVQGMEDPATNAAIRAVAGFARSMGAELIAEGVEDVGTVPVLRSMGINLGQGFGLGRPAFIAASGDRLVASSTR